MALLSKFQDNQAIVLDGLNLNEPQTKVVAKALRAIRRPELTETEAAEVVGETKTRRNEPLRTVGPDRHSRVRPGPLPHAQHRGRRGRSGEQFNTYDILKQRYLVLTREALTALEQRVKEDTEPLDSTAATQPAAGPES